MEKDYRKISKNNNLGKQEKEHLHYRMYKAKKSWLFAGMFMLGLLSVSSPAKADTQQATVDTNQADANTTSASTNTADDVNASSVALKSASNSANSSTVSQSDTNSVANADSTQTTPTTSADTTTTDSNADSTQTDTTDQSAKSTTDANKTATTQSDTDLTQQAKSAQDGSSSTATTAQKAASDATTASTTLDGSKLAAATDQTASDANKQNVANTEIAAAMAELPSNVKVTSENGVTKITLVNPTTEELNEAKQSAASLYKSKGVTVEIDALDAGTDLPVGDPDTANYKAGYQAAANDLINHKGLASTGSIGDTLAQADITMQYTLLSNLYGLGKVYEAGRMANGADTSKDIHYTMDDITKQDRAPILGIGGSQGKTNVDIPTTKTTNPYNIDITNPNSWWIDSKNDGISTSGGSIFGGGTTTNLQSDKDFQAGYQAFIKQWAQSLDNFYTNLGSSLKSDGDAYANAINYDSSAESGQTIGLPIIGGVLGLLGADSVSNRLSNASTQSKAIYQLYVDAENQAYSQAQASVTDSNALKAIQTNLGDVVHVWDYYIPLFQPLIQSYLEKAIMSNPVSLAGQNDFDVQFLNDGTTFADIVFNIMNGFNYNGNYLTFAVKDHLGDIDFPREIFSQFVTAIYPAIRNVIEHVDYAAAIDGENDFFDDYLNKANAITQSNGKLSTSDNVSLNGKIGFDKDQPVGKSTQLSHDGFYNTADTFLGKIKEAAFDAAVSGQGGDASQFYLNSGNTNGQAVVLDKKGNVYADYSKDLGDTNAMIQATYDAEYQAVVHAIADYKAGQKHNYAVKYTTYSDGSYSYTWDQQAGSDGKFTWTNPAAVNDTKRWYRGAIGTTTSYSDGKDNKYATYDINVADYNNMYNYLASQKDATPATVVATVDYVVNPGKDNEVIVGTGNAVGTDGSKLTVTLTPPAGYELLDPATKTWSVTLNANGTNETKVGVQAIVYDVNNPGTLPGTSIDYLQGTANLTDITKDSSSSTGPSSKTRSVKIKRTAQLDPTTNQVKYGNWQTIDNSDTIVAPLDAQSDASQTSLVSIDIKTGDYQANNTTYPGVHVATLTGNVAVTGEDLGQKRVTNPSVTSSGNDNEYLGQKPAEVFDITRTIVTVPSSEVKGTLTVTTNYTGDFHKDPVVTPVNVTRDASIDANGHVTYGAWTVKGSTDATAPLVSELLAADPSLAQAGFTVTNVDAPAYTSAQFAQDAKAGTTGYTAAITRTVTYTKKTYTTTTPGGTNDPAGTQAKYLEGTITVHRTNTGDYTAAVDDKPVSVTRDAWIDTDGTTVKYGDWKAADGTDILVAKLTPDAVGVAQAGFTATIKAGEGDTDYTSANFKAVTDGQTPTDTGYSVTVNQTVNYKADKVSYQVDLYDGYANQTIDSFTMTSIPGSTVDFTKDPAVLSVLQKHTGYIITPVINGVDANKGYHAVKVVNNQSYGVFVSKIASPIQVNLVNTDGTPISGSKNMPMYQITTTTPGAELVVGQTYTLTPDTVSGYNYQGYDFNGTAGTGTPTVTLTDKDNIFKLVYGTKTYTTTTPGGTNDPKGTQAAYLEGKIIVHQANTGDYSVDGPTETVHVSRTATLGGIDGKTVVYGAWTRDDKPGTDLVPVLTDADVAVSGYKADIKNGDGMTSAQFKVLTDKATAPGIDGYTATINHLVNYTKIVYTTTNPGGTDDPAGTQAKYLEGTITVNRTNSGDYTVSPDPQTVRVTRTASLKTDGTVGYSYWVIAGSTNDGTTNTVLVPALTDASVAVPGYTPNILNGDGLDSDGFEAINTSAAGKLTDDGYTATVNQTVNYLKTIYTTTAPGGDSDPHGTQAQYLKGKITVTRANTGDYTVPVKDQTVDVTRTASLNEDGEVTYTDWKTADGSTILVPELTEADAAVPGYTAQVFNGGAYKSASFNAGIDGTEPDATKGYYTATVERGVNYKAKTYTTTTPGGTDDPAGTQAKYLEGTITVTTTYTGGPDKATKTANVAVTRT
ncbi:KxYKxGKxW signal peptide domain-containing protein, partial [Lactobacillus sp. LC28-10]